MSTVAMPERTGTVSKYLSLVKFSHTVFALPFACVGFTIAIAHHHYAFKWQLLLCMLLCMVFARSAAMAFNRYLDRHFDAKNPRTAVREIPAGKIAPKHALIFTVINCILFVITTCFINKVCLYLSPVALLVILFYSYTKRFTSLCHIVLGLGLALAPIGAYLAVTGVFHILPLYFSFTVLCWVSGFDIIYALQDEQFDRGERLHSIPVALGAKNALRVSNLLHLGAALFVIIAGITADFGIIYWIGTTFFIGLLIYQHLLVKPDDLSKVNMAFANTNGVASITFAILAILDMVL